MRQHDDSAHAGASTNAFSRHRTAWICAGVAAVLVLVYAAAGFLLAPRLIESYLEREIARRTSMDAQIGAVHVNPFALTAALDDVRVGDPARPMLAAHEVTIDMELGSLVERRWTATRVRLTRPVLNATVLHDGRIDVVRTLERLRARSEPDAQRGLPAFLVRDVRVDDATLSIRDPEAPGPIEYAVQSLNLHVEQLGTAQGTHSPYQLRARFPEGGTLEADGRLSIADREASGSVNAQRFHVARVWPLLHRMFTGPAVRATVELHGAFEVGYGPATTLRLDQVSVAARDIAAGKDDARVLALGSAAAEGGRFDLAERSIAFRSVELHKGSVQATPLMEGRVGWHTVEPRRKAPPAARVTHVDSASKAARAPGATADAPWRVSVDKVRVSDFAASLCRPGADEPLCARGSVRHASAALAARFGHAATDVRVDALDATLAQLMLQLGRPGGDAEPQVSIDTLAVSAGSLDTGARRVRASRVAVNGGSIALARMPNGHVALLDAIARAAPASAPKGPSSEPWRYAVGEASVQDVAFDVRDRTYAPAFEVQGTVKAASIATLDSERSDTMPFEVDVRLAAGGSASVDGTVDPGFTRASAEARLDKVALALVGPVVKRYARIDVSAGTLSADARVQVSRAGSQAGVQGTGSLSIDGLAVREHDSGDKLLSWRALSAKDVSFSSAERTLAVDRVDIAAPVARLVITENRKLEIARLLTAPADAPDAGEPQRDGAPQRDGEPWQLGIRRVAFEDGEIAFTDRSLVLPFSIDVSAFEGALVGVDRGMSLDDAAPARIEAHGRVGEYGEVAVEGDLDVFRPTSSLDLHASFTNVAFPTLSPYTATFAGRKIASGKLSLDLSYVVDDGELRGENDVRISNLELGERVDAPDAMDLPLELAVALLTDAKGRIALEIPVHGSVGNPEFAIGGLIREAIGKVVRRLVTAPFRALGRLFGTGDDGSVASEVGFHDGSAELTPPGRETLDRVADAMAQRPRLTLSIAAPYDEVRDAHALRADAVRRALAERLGDAARSGALKGPIAFGDPEVQRAIDALLRERNEADEAPTDDRSASRYGRMYEHLVATQPLPERALQTLAIARAHAIAEHLQAEGLGADRIDTGRIVAVHAGRDERVQAPLALAPGKGSPATPTVATAQD